MYRNSKRSKSVISMIICMVLIFVMFFSILFIAKEADHECTGADCPICQEIQVCIELLKTMGSAMGSNADLVAVLLCTAGVVAIGKPIHIIGSTLVSLKVKLTD